MSYLGFCVYYVYNFTNHQTALGVIYFHNSLIQKNDWVTLLFVCIMFITLQIIKLPRAWYLFISVWYKSMIQLLWFLVCIMFINLQIIKLPRASYFFILVSHKSMIELLWFLVSISFITLKIIKLPRALYLSISVWYKIMIELHL